MAQLTALITYIQPWALGLGTLGLMGVGYGMIFHPQNEFLMHHGSRALLGGGVIFGAAALAGAAGL